MKLLMENWREFLVEDVVKINLPYENPDDLLHKVFGLQSSEKEGKLKPLFRQLALKYHPDRNQEEGAEAKFKEIRPKTLGQALRIDGITPAAVYILLSHVKRKSIKQIA